MRRRKGFTLVEMLAVIGIMLVLVAYMMNASLSAMINWLAPDKTLSVVQAAMNRARDYAATNGKATRVKFVLDPAKPKAGTTLTIEYQETGAAATDWMPIRGMAPVALPDQMYVLKDIPNLGLAPPPDPVNRRNPTDDEIRKWKKFQQDVLDKVTAHALSSGGVRTEHALFYVEFDAFGYLAVVPTDQQKTAQNGLTVVTVAGGRATEYAFYPMNSNTGTRLVFE